MTAREHKELSKCIHDLEHVFVADALNPKHSRFHREQSAIAAGQELTRILTLFGVDGEEERAKVLRVKVQVKHRAYRTA
jgi:hypothetical protein